ncbi:MAG TPA: YqgE/AlgH family protein, partial [Woeseiaceae bacterium]
MSQTSFSNQLLIAMPGMLDPNFSSTVTLICEHNAEGALGIVIN